MVMFTACPSSAIPADSCRRAARRLLRSPRTTPR
jgi:hypothetical protein